MAEQSGGPGALGELQQRLGRALWRVDAGEPGRHNTSVPAEAFAPRCTRWRAELRAVLSGSPASLVTDARAPCAGGDVLSLAAAFPSARSLTLISREPIGDAGALLRFSADEANILDASVETVFRTSRGGAFQLGHLVRPFCDKYGVLPLLLAGAHAAGLAVDGPVRPVDVGGLSGLELRLRSVDARRVPRAPTASGGAGYVLLRYVRADLASAPNRTALRALDAQPRLTGQKQNPPGAAGPSRQPAPRGAVVGYLVKGAEAAFRSPAVGRLVLRSADVLFQDLQTGVPWPAVHAWASAMSPLGSHVPELPLSGDDAPPPATARGPARERQAASDAAARAQQRQLRALWRAGRALPAKDPRRWRSLRGVRFGYCRFESTVSERARPFVARTGEPAIAAENDAEEQERPILCGALLAWRCRHGHAPRAGGKGDDGGGGRAAESPLSRFCPDAQGQRS